VLLDALGTLVELQPPAPRLVRELSARFGLTVDPACAADAIAAEIAYYRAHLEEGRDESSLAALRTRCAEVVRDSLSLSADLDLTDALLASLEFRCYGDVTPALETLRGRGLRLVVVSNWDVSLGAVLDRLGISELLDGVLTSAEVGVRKPAAEIFRRGLLLAGVQAGDAVHVGDGLEEDVRGALAAGVEPIWLRRGGASGEAPRGKAPPGVRVIGSLAELPDMV
jgi:putative hydrolase of the HAD superfamily